MKKALSHLLLALFLIAAGGAVLYFMGSALLYIARETLFPLILYIPMLCLAGLLPLCFGVWYMICIILKKDD